MTQEKAQSDDQEKAAIGTVYEHALTIPETFLDMFAHMNNAAYLTVFEQARWEILAAHNFGVRDIQKTMLGPTILEVRLQFKREVRGRERIVVRSFVTAQSRKVTHLRQVMVRTDGEPAAIADFVVALFDVKARKIVEPTPEWKKMLGLPDGI